MAMFAMSCKNFSINLDKDKDTTTYNARPCREQNATRAAIARHKTCLILWRVIVAHPKDLGVRLKNF